MKTLRIFAAAALVMMAVACSAKGSKAASVEGADSLATETPVKPSKALLDSVSYYLGVNYGQMLKQYDFGDVNYKLMVKGMKDFVAAEGKPQDENFTDQFKMNPEEMNEVINRYLGELQIYKGALNSTKSKKFLAENKTKAGVTETESGLQYIIEEAGNENHPGPMDTVYVHYTGTLIDGTVFDEVKPDDSAVMLTLNRVIPAWTEGLQLVGEGGKIKLFAPADLAYGERGAGDIPGNSALIFDVVVDSVKTYVVPEPVAEPAK